MPASSSMTYPLAISSQVIYLGSGIIKSILKEHSAPEGVTASIQQIWELVLASELFQKTPALQTNEVLALLRSCYGKIKAVHSQLKWSLSDVEVRIGDWKSSDSPVWPYQLQCLFDNLDREQTNLILSLQAIQQNILADIEKEFCTEDTAIIDKNLSSPSISAMKVIDNAVLPNLIQKLQTQQETASNIEIQVTGTYGIPTRHGVKFLGREDSLEQLSQSIPIFETFTPRVIIIQGVKGQGKTQLALEFCSRALEKNLFTAIFWVDASSEANVKMCFWSFYLKIFGSQQNVVEPGTKVELVLNTLSSLKAPWLLIFDNYDDPAKFKNVRNFFPQTGQGTILLITRQSGTFGLPNEGFFIELGGLKPTVGVALLLKDCQINLTETANCDALVIVEKLKHHALTIIQASSYISSSGIQLNEFLDKIDSRKDFILQRGPELSNYTAKFRATEKATSVNAFVTWELAFEQLESRDHDGSMVSLLTLLAFFDCNDFSERLFQEFCDRIGSSGDNLEVFSRYVVSSPGNMNEACITKDDTEDETDQQNEDNMSFTYVWNSSAFGDVLNDLRQLSLIQTLDILDDEYHHISIHPLVSEWTKVRIKDPKVQQECLSLSFDILHNAALSFENINEPYDRTFPARQIVLTNIDTAWQNLQELLKIQSSISSFQNIGAIESLGDIANFLSSEGKYQEALQWERLKTRLWIETFGTVTLAQKNKLADALFEAGELDEAATIAKEVINIASASVDDDMIIRARELLVSCLIHANQLSAAEALYRDVLANEASIPKHYLSTVLASFASVLLKQNNHLECEAVMRNACARNLRDFGPYDGRTIETDSNYILSLLAVDRVVEAEELALDVVERIQELIGPEHPANFKAAQRLGRVLLAQGRYDDAKTLCEAALAWYIRNFGSHNPVTRFSRELVEKIEAARSKL